MTKLSRASISAALIATMGAAALFAAGPFAPYGVDRQRATADIISSFTTGSVAFHALKEQFRSAAAPARVAMVEQILNWTKAYVSSPAFKADYDRERANAKPETQTAGGSVDDAVKKEIAEQEAQIAEMKKVLESMPPEQRKEMEKNLNKSIAAIREARKDPQFQKGMRQSVADRLESDQKSDEAALQEWNEKYPADPKALVAKRLREFLDLSATVDYNAQLVSTKSGRKKFANPAYEAKPYEWKLCYRAGKEPVEKARTFASAWLKELSGK